jgi:hypothetical protein
MGAFGSQQFRKMVDAISLFTKSHSQKLLLVLDLQVGLYQLARDFDATLYQRNMIAHSALGKLFDLPVILTSSAEQGMRSSTGIRNT